VCDQYLLRKVNQLLKLRKSFISIIILTPLILILINIDLLTLIISLIIESIILGYVYIHEENRVIGKFSVYLINITKTDDIRQAILNLLGNEKECEFIEIINLDTIKKICDCVNKRTS